MPCTQRSRLRATSAMETLAPREADACVWSRKTTEPPILWMPTSKVTRGRSECAANIGGKNAPFRRAATLREQRAESRDTIALHTHQPQQQATEHVTHI